MFKINKRKVIVAVKNKQKLGTGEEIRVAYSWTNDKEDVDRNTGTHSRSGWK